MLFSAFYSILLSIGAGHTVEAYFTTKLSCLTDLHYKVVTLSAQIISKFNYDYNIVQGSQFYMSGVVLALFMQY